MNKNFSGTARYVVLALFAFSMSMALAGAHGTLSLTVSPSSTGTANAVASGYTTCATTTTTLCNGGNDYSGGTTITLHAIQKSGYVFSGWTGTGTNSYTGSSATHTITIADGNGNDVTETAKFVAVTSTTTTATSTSTTSSSTSTSTSTTSTTTISTPGTLYLSALTQVWGIAGGNPITSGNFITINITSYKVANIITFNGMAPYAIVLSPNNKYAYVEDIGGSGSCGPGFACVADVYAGNHISMINLGTDTVANTIALPGYVGYDSYLSLGWGENPEPILVSPDGTSLYVGYVAAVGGQIAKINTATFAITNTITLGNWGPGQLAITPDGKQLFVVGSDGTIVKAPQAVTIINTTTDTISNTVACPGAYCDGVLIPPNGKSAYVTTEPTDCPCNTLIVINTTTKASSTFHGLPSSFYGYPPVIAATPNSSFLYSSNESYGIDVIGTATNKIANALTVAQQFPYVIEMSSTGNIADMLGYLGNYANVVSINTATNKIIKVSSAIPANQFDSQAGGSDAYGIMNISPDGTTAYLSGGLENSLAVLNTQNGNTINIPLTDLPVWMQIAVPP